MKTTQAARPLTSVLTQVVSDVAYLLQTEIRLARAELNEKLGKIATSGKLLATGGILVLAGLIVLLLAIASWLTVAGLPEELALTLVGGIVSAIGLALVLRGGKALSGSAIKPKRTVDSVLSDISIVKEHVR